MLIRRGANGAERYAYFISHLLVQISTDYSYSRHTFDCAPQSFISLIYLQSSLTSMADFVKEMWQDGRSSLRA
jgi:hypothetical protein